MCLIGLIINMLLLMAEMQENRKKKYLYIIVLQTIPNDVITRANLVRNLLESI